MSLSEHSNTQLMKNYVQSVPEWQDDIRMRALFGALPDKEVAEDSWNSKVRFWKDMIAKTVEHGKQLHCTIGEMQTVFSRQGASPLCLVKIFEHLRNENEVLPTIKTESGRITLPNIENSSSSGSSWWGWVKSFVGSSSTSSNEIPLNQQLAIISLVAKHATTLQSEVQTMAMDHSDYLLLESELFAIEALQSFDIEDRYVILAYLESQHKAASIQLNNEVGYKIGRLKSNSTVEVSDSDRDILVVKHTLMQVQQKYEQMQKEIVQLKKQALEARKAGKKVVAISLLKRSKARQEAAEKLPAVIAKLESIWFAIKQAETDAAVLEAYKAGASAIRQVTSDAGLTVEAVEDAIAELHDAFADQEHAEEILASAAFGSSKATAEEELEELEKELSSILLNPSEGPYCSAGRPLPPSSSVSSSSSSNVEPSVPVPLEKEPTLEELEALLEEDSHIVLPSVPSHSPEDELKARQLNATKSQAERPLLA